jgi:sulfate transporter 3
MACGYIININLLGQNLQVAISVFKILLHVSRPNTLVLGNIPGTQIFHNINQYKEALRVPSFLILAVESPIYFANSTYLRERLEKEISRIL